MLQFEYSSLIQAPVEAVFGFHERPDAFQKLAPPFPRVEIVRRDGDIEVGAVTTVRLWFGPFYTTWIAHHIAYEKNRLFMDEQRKGPFRAWVHAHQFASEGAGTRLTDSIEFSLRGGITAERAFGWLVRRELTRVFRYRHEVTRRECERS